jgi:hypothetical protein
MALNSGVSNMAIMVSDNWIPKIGGPHYQGWWVPLASTPWPISEWVKVAVQLPPILAQQKSQYKLINTHYNPFVFYCGKFL